MSKISSDISAKLLQKGINRIVVLYIKDINKQTTAADKYLADIISIDIVNEQGNFYVFNRDNLDGIVEAKKLIAEGFINYEQTKELAKILSVDAILTGNYTILSNNVNLHFQLLMPKLVL